MTRAVHVPYTVEQDEDGIWCAHSNCVRAWGLTAGVRQHMLPSRTCARQWRALIAEFGASDEITGLL